MIRTLLAIGALTVGIGSPAWGQVRFRGFPESSGSATWITNMDPAGEVFIGVALTQTRARPLRWTDETGYEDLGILPAGPNPNPATWAEGVSAGGSVVVGHSYSGAAMTERAVRWTAGGIEDLGVGAGNTRSRAYDVTPDGSVIVGEMGSSAFRWTEEDGAISIGALSNVDFTRARAVSADGSVIAGWGALGTSAARAFRWTFETGMVELGGVPGYARSVINGMSADGAISVGWAIRGASETIAVRWTEFGGAEVLPTFLGAVRSLAYGASQDGGVIVGSITTAESEHAVMWTADGEIVDLRRLLEARGVDLSEWISLGSARTVSDDGMTIGGIGNFRFSGQLGIALPWVVTLPSPGIGAMLGVGLLVSVVRRGRSRAD